MKPYRSTTGQLPGGLSQGLDTESESVCETCLIFCQLDGKLQSIITDSVNIAPEPRKIKKNNQYKRHRLGMTNSGIKYVYPRTELGLIKYRYFCNILGGPTSWEIF